MAGFSQATPLPKTSQVFPSEFSSCSRSVSNVLFATDFSSCSRAALPYACAITRHFGAVLHLVHVVGPVPMIGPLGSPYTDVYYQDQLAQRELASIADDPAVKQVRHCESLHRGIVGDVVSRIVFDRSIDLIVLGTHGRSGLKYFVLGSVAEHIIRHATCPVMTIGPGVCKDGPPEGRFARVLLATNFSPASMDALNYALSIACANNATLILFHAIVGEATETDEEYMEYLKDATEGSGEQLGKLVPENLSIGCEILMKPALSPKTSTAEMILEAATDNRADLIVMGARRGTTVAAHAPRAIAHTVVCRAPCPVMTISR